MADLLVLFMSSLDEHSYTCFARTGCRAPRRYSSDNGPSVHTWLDPEMADHLGTRGSSPSTAFNRVMMVAKFFSTPTRSSTLHSSWRVYPHSGASSVSTGYFSFSTGTLVVLPEESASCSEVPLLLRFLRLDPSSTLARFSTVEPMGTTEANAPVADGTVDPLPAPSSDFIFQGLNIFTQQVSSVESAGTELFTVREVHSIGKL
ncbi:hypothetical protein BHM03_00040230 [Ensete ventricosum]|nr:hypothetical protein BHM03_00040230 [Ensete ventricosum]